MMERCFASNGTPLGPTTAAGPGLSPVIAGAAGVATTWAVTRAGFGGGAPAGALAARAGGGATALAGGRTGASAPGIGAGGRGARSVAAASPVLGSGAGRGSGTLSAPAAPMKP